MRLLHIADLHIGKLLKKWSLEEDQKFVFKQILEMLHKGVADACLIAGDIYDRSDPSTDAVALFNWFLTELATTRVPVLIIPGNHDSAVRLSFASTLLSSNKVFIAAPLDNDSNPIQSVTLQDEYGEVVFWLFPFVRPAVLQSRFPEARFQNDTEAMDFLIKTCKIDPTKRNVALVHQFVSEPGNEPEHFDSETVGNLHSIDSSVFKDFDYVALGHLHGPHSLAGGRVRYSGSPLKYSLSEIHNEKSATLATLGPKNPGSYAELTVGAIPLKTEHEVSRLKGTLDELITLANGHCDDYVELTLTDDELPFDSYQSLRQYYSHILSVTYKHDEYAAQISLADQILDAATAKTLGEHFKDFFEQSLGYPPTERQVKIIDELLSDEEELSS